VSATCALHLIDAPLVTSRRGQFWIPGDVISTPSGTAQRGPMYVKWEAPEVVSQPYPVVLVHDGGGQIAVAPDLEHVRRADPADLVVSSLVTKPVAVFTASASAFRDFAPATVDFLNAAGADAEWVDLENSGIVGNGHGLIFEANAHETVRPVIDWICGLEE